MTAILGECNCSCHSGHLALRHVKPCCKKCPHCQKNIKPAFYKEHILTHEDNFQNGSDGIQSSNDSIRRDAGGGDG